MPGVSVVSEEFMRALATRFYDEYDRDPGRDSYAYTRAKYVPFTRADIMGATVTGAGDEWVGVFYENQLWEKIREQRIVDTLLQMGMRERSVDRGYESNVIPLEGDDPTVYVINEAVSVNPAGYPEIQVPESTVGTSSKTVTVKEMAARAMFTSTFDEDSLVAAASTVQRQSIEALQDALENGIVNGDTETSASTNINLIDGTPPANAKYLFADGFLKVGLVTKPAAGSDSWDASHDAGSTFDEDDFHALLDLLGENATGSHDLSKLVYIVDGRTRNTAMQIPAVKSRDVYERATIENGFVEYMWSVRMLTSGQMRLANTSGKISATATNNTRGRIILARPSEWYLGRKREITTEITRYGDAGVTSVKTSLRAGLQYRDVDYAVAAAYNVAV
jgi:hypothetical protein